MTAQNPLDSLTSIPEDQLPRFTKAYHHAPTPAISPRRPELNSHGKHVLVTGGGAGIGLSIACSFAQSGARAITIVGRKTEVVREAAEKVKASATEVGEDSVQASFQVADLVDLDQARTAFQAAVDQFGPIDVLVANAGSIGSAGTPAECETGHKLLDSVGTNLVSTFNSLKAFVSTMKANTQDGEKPVGMKGKKVLVVSTAMVHNPPRMGVTLGYAVGKTAAFKTAEHFAFEYPDLHFVYMQPGVVPTALSGFRLGQDDASLPGHFGVWLMSEEASFLRNRFIWANWDAEELLQRKEEIEGSRLLTINLIGMVLPSD